MFMRPHWLGRARCPPARPRSAGAARRAVYCIPRPGRGRPRPRPARAPRPLDTPLDIAVTRALGDGFGFGVWRENVKIAHPHAQGHAAWSSLLHATRTASATRTRPTRPYSGAARAEVPSHTPESHPRMLHPSIAPSPAAEPWAEPATRVSGPQATGLAPATCLRMASYSPSVCTSCSVSRYSCSACQHVWSM